MRRVLAPRSRKAVERFVTGSSPAHLFLPVVRVAAVIFSAMRNHQGTSRVIKKTQLAWELRFAPFGSLLESMLVRIRIRRRYVQKVIGALGWIKNRRECVAIRARSGHGAQGFRR